MLKIKKILGITLSILLILSAVPVFAFAENTYYTSEDGYLTYKIENGEAIIIGCDTSISGDYTIPSTLGGYPVTEIISRENEKHAYGVFYLCTSLEGITIPDSMISIGYSAFCGCTSLKSITIPDSVTSIGASAFYDTAYYNDDSNWEDGVLYIGNHLIEAQTSISGSYEIKDGIKTIADDAFSGCTSLESITIPDSVTSIGSHIVSYCPLLESITVDEGNKYYSNDEYGVLFNKNKTELVAFPAGSNLTSYSIPDSVTTIGDYGFAWCESLTSITIPDSVTSIGGSAFYNCTSLASIEIPDSVTSIDYGVFYGCTSLTNVAIPDSVTEIGHSVFSYTAYYNNDSNWEDGVLYIGNHLIEVNSDIIGSSYEIKEGTITIADSAFSICKSLTNITIPDSVTTIGEEAFCYCTSLTSVTIPAGVESIGEYAFGYYFDYTTWAYYFVDGFTIYGYDNTAAETYANENGITFISLGEYAEVEEITTEEPTVEESVSEEPSSQAVSNNDSSGTFIYILIAAIIGMLVIAAVIVVIVLVVTKNNRNKTPQPPKYNGTYN